MLFAIFMIYAVTAILTTVFLTCVGGDFREACAAGLLWPHFWWYIISRRI